MIEFLSRTMDHFGNQNFLICKHYLPDFTICLLDEIEKIHPKQYNFHKKRIGIYLTRPIIQSEHIHYNKTLKHLSLTMLELIKNDKDIEFHLIPFGIDKNNDKGNDILIQEDLVERMYRNWFT